jgi:hypothetical protein
MIFQIQSHVDRPGGNRDFVDLFPRHLEVRAAGLDNPDLRVAVARSLLRTKGFRNGIVQCSLAARHTDRAAEASLHGTLVLVHRVQAHHKESGAGASACQAAGSGGAVARQAKAPARSFAAEVNIADVNRDGKPDLGKPVSDCAPHTRL